MSKNKKYCIIAGAPRSGTTSLFSYLTAHPDVSGSYLKQTNYFIDLEYRGILGNPIKHCSNVNDSYSDVFVAQADKVLSVEASPDYIYSAGSAKAIFKNIGGSVCLVFLLRNPVEQFLSFWQHNISLGLAPVDADIDDFVAENLTNSKASSRLAVEKGRYVSYLQKYCELFNSEDLIFLFTEDLSADAKGVMSTLSDRIGLDSVFYETYDFEQFNNANSTRSRSVQRVYRYVRRAGLSLIVRSKGWSKWLEPVRHVFSVGYKQLNTSAVKKQLLSEQSRDSLVEFYRADYEALKDLLGRDPPWSDFKG